MFVDNEQYNLMSREVIVSNLRRIHIRIILEAVVPVYPYTFWYTEVLRIDYNQMTIKQRGPYAGQDSVLGEQSRVRPIETPP